MSGSALCLRGRYELGAPVGHGTFGSTHVALDRETGAEVVCKLVRIRGMPGWKPLEHFEREVAALRAIDHAGVPRFVDAFETELAPNDPAMVLVMERVPGATLLELVERGERWSEARARALLGRLLEILAHLHALSPPVIHRDIKPSNIVVRPDATPALVDFGGVRDAMMRTGHGSLTVVGTAGYMPPEQAMGVAGPSSDLFSLGATMIHALTHVHPADLPRRGLRLAFEDRVGCSPALVAVLRRLVEPELAHRYARAEEALRDLQAPPEALVPRSPASEATLAREPTASILPSSSPRALTRAAAATIEGHAVTEAAGAAGVAALAGLGACAAAAMAHAPAFILGTIASATAAGIVAAWRRRRNASAQRWTALYERGAAAAGRVQNVRREMSGGELYAEVAFAYEVDDEDHVGELVLAGDAARLVEPQDPVIVVHDPAQPGRHIAAVQLPEEIAQARRYRRMH